MDERQKMIALEKVVHVIRVFYFLTIDLFMPIIFQLGLMQRFMLVVV